MLTAVPKKLRRRSISLQRGDKARDRLGEQGVLGMLADDFVAILGQDGESLSPFRRGQVRCAGAYREFSLARGTTGKNLREQLCVNACLRRQASGRAA